MAIDIIGTVHKKTGRVMKDKDGFEYPEMSPTWGYHVNTIDEVIEGADDYIMSEETVTRRQGKGDPQADKWQRPETPSRLYLGRDASEHVLYRFPDEATFRQFVPEQPQEVIDELQQA